MLDVYRTRQLPQAAFLLASGAKFLRCEPTKGRFCDLVFSDPDGKVARLAEAYWDDAPCAALSFYRALTEMRRAIAEATGTTWEVRRG
jgi:hypothetical protein